MVQFYRGVYGSYLKLPRAIPRRGNLHILNTACYHKSTIVMIPFLLRLMIIIRFSYIKLVLFFLANILSISAFNGLDTRNRNDEQPKNAANEQQL